MERKNHYPVTVNFILFKKASNDIKEFVYWYSHWSFGLQQIVDGDRCYLYPISQVIMIEKDHKPMIDHPIRMTYMDSMSKERVRPICIPMGDDQENNDFYELFEDLCNKFLDIDGSEEIYKKTKELIWMLLCNRYHDHVCNDEEIREIEGKRIIHKE